MPTIWESSFAGGRGDDLLGAAVEDGLGGLLDEEDAGGLADTVGAKGAPPDLLGVAVADGVVLVLLDHAVGGGRPGVDGIELDVVVLTHIAVLMDMEVVLEGALTAVPAHCRAAPVPSVLDVERHWPGR